MAKEAPFSEDEIAQLKLKLSKNHQTDKDWQAIGDLFQGKFLYTMQPKDRFLMEQFCFQGVLHAKGNLIVFTNPKDCVEYGKQHPVALSGGYLEMGLIPFQTVKNIADDHKISALIDVKTGLNEKYLTYDGKNQSFHVFIIQNL